MYKPSSIKHVVDIIEIIGRDSDVDAVPQLLIEIPHGATETEHYVELASRLTSPLPDDLIQFFYVNTDVAAPELALFIAEIFSRLNLSYKILIVRSLIPRTFVDCNRIISTSDEADIEAGVTSGIPSYITTAEDHQLLRARYDCYQVEAQKAYRYVCGNGGVALMLHSYAPKSVGISAVDQTIIERLKEVYAPDLYSTWKLRPEIDFIHKAPSGTILISPLAREILSRRLEESGYQVAQGESYPLHPATTGYGHAKKYPQQTICLEVRRDLLVVSFEPFSPML